MLRLNLIRRRAGAKLGFFKRVCHWVPHPAKAATGGEDAFLSSDYVIGVCDGVSWWHENLPKSVQSELYSEVLAKTALEVAEEDWLGDPPEGIVGGHTQHPSAHLLQKAFLRTRAAVASGEAFVKEILAAQDAGSKGEDGPYSAVVPHVPSPLLVGTTTALFVTITADNFIDVANLGDSCCLVIRDGEIILETTAQHHSLATPFQLGTGSSDTPAKAEELSVQAKAGDIVVLGTDGIFDNLYSRDILKIVGSRFSEIADQRTLVSNLGTTLLSPQVSSRQRDLNSYHEVIETILNLTPQNLANMTRDDREQLALHVAALQIIRAASLNAFDPKSDTPYATQCIEAGAYFEGGKIDDMTVQVAVVGENSNSSGERFSQSVLTSSLPYKNWP